MKSTEKTSNNFANINNIDKKKIIFKKLNSKMIKSRSQPNLFDKNIKTIKKIIKKYLRKKKIIITKVIQKLY